MSEGSSPALSAKSSSIVTKFSKRIGKTLNEQFLAEATTAGCWRRFRQWFHCFCVVTFDLELGQTIEVIYPGDAILTAQERSDLCYAAFPDSNSTSTPPLGFKTSPILDKVHPISYDSMHHFRIRRTSFHERNNTAYLEEFWPASLRPDSKFFHGFSFFRRQHDPLLPRGYFQKSIVLLTVLPLCTLFQRALYEVALAFFARGETAFESVCYQIDRHWPPPTSVGCSLSLPLFDLHFHYSIPSNSDGHGFLSTIEDLKVDSNVTSKCHKFSLHNACERFTGKIGDFGHEQQAVDFSNNNNYSGSSNCHHIQMIGSPEMEADRQFNEMIKLLLPHLQLIWELILLGEPLLVLAPTASLSSALVNALITLISPLRYYGDYRPFFSIHDSDFIELSARQNCCVNNFVLGVTNPFFLKAFAHWPHILKIGHCSAKNGHHESISKEGSPVKSERDNGRGEVFLTGCRKVERVLRNAKTIKRVSGHAQLDQHSIGALLSTHRQFLNDDKLLAQKLLKKIDDSASLWHSLGQHFMQLTQSFINPLERYIASLLPLRRYLCPFQPVPSVRPFSLEQFLSKLTHFGHPGVRGDWQGLYRQFVTRSPNFVGWLQQRRKHIERQLNEEHLELLCSANLSAEVLCHRNQVEIVDLVLKFRDRLAELDEHCSIDEHRQQMDQHHTKSNLSSSPLKKQHIVDRQRMQLQQQLSCLLGLVDDELKNLLMSNNTLRRAVVNEEEATVLPSMLIN